MLPLVVIELPHAVQLVVVVVLVFDNHHFLDHIRDMPVFVNELVVLVVQVCHKLDDTVLDKLVVELQLVLVVVVVVVAVAVVDIVVVQLLDIHVEDKPVVFVLVLPIVDDDVLLELVPVAVLVVVLAVVLAVVLVEHVGVLVYLIPAVHLVGFVVLVAALVVHVLLPVSLVLFVSLFWHVQHKLDQDQ